MQKEKESSEASHYLKMLVKVSAFIFVATIVSKLATYGYKILVVRYFGVEKYGLFSLAIIVIGIVAALATLGLNEGIVRYISFYRGRGEFSNIKKLISNSRKIFIFSSIVTMVVIIILAPFISETIFHNKEFTPMLKGMALGLPFILLAGLYLAILRGFEKIKTYSFLINIYQNITRLALITLLILAGIGAVSITISYVTTFIGLATLSYYYSKKEIVSIEADAIKPAGRIMYEILSYSWPLMFVGVLYNIFYWSDSLVLGYLNDAVDVGLYNVAVTIISLFGIALDLFMQLLFPLVSFKLSEDKKELIKKLVRQVMKWIYLINIPLFIFIFLFPEKIIYILFKVNDPIASQVLQILSIGVLFLNTVVLATSLLSIKGRTKLVLANFAVFTVLNIALDFLLIPNYGMLGAATATLVTAISFSTCLMLQIKRIYGFGIIASYFSKLILVGVAMFFVMYLVSGYVRESLFAIVTSGIVVVIFYLVALYLLKILDAEDMEIIHAIFKKTRLNKI